MCLAVPALIISIEGQEAEVDLAGARRRVGLQLTPEARVGDYVLVHTGFAINVLDPDEAAETLRLLAELDAFESSGTRGSSGTAQGQDPERPLNPASEQEAPGKDGAPV